MLKCLLRILLCFKFAPKLIKQTNIKIKINSKMKKVLLPLVAVVAFTFTSCEKKNNEATPVATDVENVQGENVADAQEDVNAEVADAQKALNDAQQALEEAKAKGDEAAAKVAERKSC